MIKEETTDSIVKEKSPLLLLSLVQRQDLGSSHFQKKNPFMYNAALLLSVLL